jgi:hypothetical protein
VNLFPAAGQRAEKYRYQQTSGRQRRMIDGGAHFVYATGAHYQREPQFMSHNKRPTDRKPATKFAHLRKKMDQTKVRGNIKQIRRTTHK